MPVIRVEHIDRGFPRGDSTMKVVAGRINVAARQGSYPAGSFQLRRIVGLVLTESDPSVKRRVMGSVRNPQGAMGETSDNTVLLRAILTGSTGTRSTTMATIGSTAGAGTATTASFLAWGY